jgi:enhancing lycopene biosynthesis protein 2
LKKIECLAGSNFSDIRTGYACGWCEIKNGVLTLIPHPHSGQQTRTFRHPNEAEVVGRVTGVAMSITENHFMSIEERTRRNEPKK